LQQKKSSYSSSLTSAISISLVSIIAIGLLTIFSLLWATDQTDKDAQAINLSGSIRMQSYRIGLAVKEGDRQIAESYIQQLDQTWQHPLFSTQQNAPSSDQLSTKFQTAEQHWLEMLRPALIDYLHGPATAQFPTPLIDDQLLLTEALVSAFQDSAEAKIHRLRAIQLAALFLTISAGSLIFYLLKNRLERPLAQLTQAAHRIGEGDYGYQVPVEGHDELALLGSVVNHMSNSIDRIYKDLDNQVKQRTEELHNNNIALEFLFNTARKILNNHQRDIDYRHLLDDLSVIIGSHIKLELCLFTEQGDRPYIHIAAQKNTISDCAERSCETCLQSTVASRPEKPGKSFNIVHDETTYGVINCHYSDSLKLWHEKLLSSVADQFALALSLSVHEDQERRMAMINERTVIARELHDSLAQALSYLQIQVTRLQKSIDNQQYHLQQPIVDELREGLSSAYRQLRELLTTFRLKIEAGGLHSALLLVISQLNERSNLNVKLHYQLSNIPLSPTEEIHLLQIIREASQNAINHSRGSTVDIYLHQQEDQSIQLLVEDDGIGIPPNAERNNHYGLAIISERSRHLKGQVDIKPRPKGGTRVAFSFTPNFLTG
jgi:two-component system nitrate/nitrite sensor histidine kinase NarX